jgi:hypothetical protein
MGCARDFHRDSFQFLLHFRQRDARDCVPFRRHADMRVALQHGPAHVPHQREHCGLRTAVLGQPRGESMPEVVETASHIGPLPQLVPAPRDIRGVRSIIVALRFARACLFGLTTRIHCYATILATTRLAPGTVLGIRTEY